jgi:hypothetical protein
MGTWTDMYEFIGGYEFIHVCGGRPGGKGWEGKACCRCRPSHSAPQRNGGAQGWR